MEKTDRETHDFMNVESFSQLPFIRPTPLKEKGIRLFGKEFGGGGGGGESTDEFDPSSVAATVAQEEPKETGGGESNRKFECHYCCRNFPTSQALGGHQNAHKRERQHAKRAHLQSAMVHSSFSEAQMYGLMNYHRLSAATTPSYNHSWGTTNSAYGASRFYGGNTSYNSSHQTPINGSPLGLWKYPGAQNSTRDHFNPSQLLSSKDEFRASRIGTTGSSSQNRYMYDAKPSVQDQVSLDLHL